MYAGAAKIDITPSGPVWMDGMLRAHQSEGVHDPLYVRALVLSPSAERAEAVALVAIDVCAVSDREAIPAREAAAAAAGIPFERVLVHATHFALGRRLLLRHLADAVRDEINHVEPGDSLLLQEVDRV